MTFDGEDEDKSDIESVYDILDAEKGQHHNIEVDTEEDREKYDDYREKIFSYHLNNYEEAVSSLQQKVNTEFEENDIIVVYGVYEDGAIVAGVRPHKRESTDIEFYMKENWAMVKAEESISPTEQFKRSEYSEELLDAFENMKVGLPEELENRALRNVEEAFEELDRNPLTREVHGTYIFPGDTESNTNPQDEG